MRTEPPQPKMPEQTEPETVTAPPTPKLPAAVQHLRRLHSHSAAPRLRQYLDSFATDPSLSHNTFKAGVHEFTRIANLNYSERATFFGNAFLGLHYNNDLTAQWNATHSDETIIAHQLNLIAPPDWDYEFEESLFILVYRGQDPAAALDQLLQGPTAIDCAIFCQLSIWFGIRRALGNKKFNQLFGGTPLYLTQSFYNRIEDPLKPFKGNPLFCFFDSDPDGKSADSMVSVAHVANHPLYKLKHPGGNYQGENCIAIGGRLIIFDPTLAEKELTKTQIAKLLCDTFNAPQNERDRDKILAYKKSDPSTIAPLHGFNWGQLIIHATELEATTIEASEFDFPIMHRLVFATDRFIAWAAKMLERDYTQGAAYKPLKDSFLSVPQTLTETIPFENRQEISFSTYRQESPLHRHLYQQSLYFCDSVMRRQSCMLVLSGKAGIGKTAAAACCAKELASRGKKVVWITEVTVSGWMDKALRREDLAQSKKEIQALLATDPDAVFLDDDNIVGYAGQVLFEEIYTWYILNAGKGLFLTSNETISFKKCFGFQLDRKYYFAPFADYTGPTFQGITIHSDLTEKSQRPSLAMRVTDLEDDEKIRRLMRVENKQSIGIIVTPEIYQAYQSQLGPVEFIPALKDIDSISSHLHSTNGEELGPVFSALTDLQKKWTYRYPLYKTTQTSTGGPCDDTWLYMYDTIGVRRFEKSSCTVVAIEALSVNFLRKEIIERNFLPQLLRVIHYAHDCGGKKIIIVNASKFSHDDLLTKIKEKITDREKERTIARLDQLFYSSELLAERPEGPSTTTLCTSGAFICRSPGAVIPYSHNFTATFFHRKTQETAAAAAPALLACAGLLFLARKLGF